MCAACSISPLNSTISYNETLDLNLSVECNRIQSVHWYTSGYGTHLSVLKTQNQFASISNNIIISTSPSECDYSISPQPLQNFSIKIIMTEAVHKVLNGILAAHGVSRNGESCTALPPARYYIENEIETTTEPPDLDCSKCVTTIVSDHTVESGYNLDNLNGR